MSAILPNVEVLMPLYLPVKFLGLLYQMRVVNVIAKHVDDLSVGYKLVYRYLFVEQLVYHFGYKFYQFDHYFHVYTQIQRLLNLLIYLQMLIRQKEVVNLQLAHLHLYFFAFY